MEIIYIDSLFFINLLTDYMLCLCTARICALQLKRLRYFFAALLGALYSAAVFIPGLGFLSSPHMKLLFGLSMALLAFAGERRPLRCAAVFFCVSAAFGGALWALGLSGALSRGFGISSRLLLAAFTLCYSLGSVIFRCRGRAEHMQKLPVRLRYMGREAEFRALPDTGNSLRDPLTGSPVMLIAPRALRQIFREDTVLFESLSPVELMEAAGRLPSLKGRLRLISFSSLGGPGLLPLFRPDSVSVDGREQRQLLAAVAPEAEGEGFEAII